MKFYFSLLAVFITLSFNFEVEGQATYEQVYSNLDFGTITELRFFPGDSRHVYVATKKGVIYTFENEAAVEEKSTFLDLRDSVNSKVESGLLGFDFHPEFEKNGHVFVYYTAQKDTIRSKVSRFKVEANDSTKAIKESEKNILEFVQPAYSHNGGKVAFGPEGYLYVAFGDGYGVGRDRLDNGQDRTNLFGTVIRINVDTTQDSLAYGIPDNNPFVGESCGSEPCRGEIYAYGLRNPWRFSFDAENGRLWLGDVGHNNYEEVNVIEKGGNYGWPIMEGSDCHVNLDDCDQSGLIKPVFDYSHEVGGAVTGGVVYRGEEVTSEKGNYIFSDYIANVVWSLSYEKNEGSFETDTTRIFEVTDIVVFNTDHQGELYMGTIPGEIYRMKSGDSAVDPQPSIPEEFELYDNYPNPFNAKTTIKFDLPVATDVKIKLYNVSGKLIRVLENERFKAGTHSITFDAEGMSTGIYIYELEAGEFSDSGKMILLK